jgi:transcription antitermination factor NusG
MASISLSPQTVSAPDTKAGMLQRACLDLLAEHERDGALPTSIRFRPSPRPGDSVRIWRGPFAGQMGLYAGMRGRAGDGAARSTRRRATGDAAAR